MFRTNRPLPAMSRLRREIPLASGVVSVANFVNNASMGLYGKIVQSPEYRDAKRQTAIEMLPDLLGPDATPLDLRFHGPDGEAHPTAHVILVSNKPYQLRSLAGMGTRERIDLGALGIVTIRISSAGDASRYRVEPYVMAGDTYSAAPYVGRGGWSWYTGSAAWMHRAAIESLFGVAQHGDELVVRPCLPSAWGQAELRLTRAGKSARVLFVRATDASPEVLAAAASARLLGVGEVVRWSTLDGAVPLLVVMNASASSQGAATELANAS